MGWTIAVAICLAAARLGDGTYHDERYCAPTLGLSTPDEIIRLTAVQTAAGSFDQACSRWNAQFADSVFR